ncbi:putative transcription factor C2H2 family [Helianthus debilis subsp. tardiflorus]
MFGGLTNGHSGYPGFPEEHRSQYDMSALPQLQLFGKFPGGCAIDNINFVGSDQDHGMASGRPVKRARDPGPVSTQQKLRISLNNNFCQDDVGLARNNNMNPNHVSTGLKLSYEEDERNSSVTTVNENLKALHPATGPLANSIKLEMDRQKELFDHYIKVQEENFVKGIRELNQKHIALLLNTLEKEVTKKLNEKDVEIVNMNRRNMELGLKIKQVAMEAQSWHYKAKYNESVANTLKNNLQQVIAQMPTQAKEGYGDSEVDDAASYTNVNDALGNPIPNQTFSMKPLNCKACNVKEVCVLLLPCRHLCLCKDCEVLVENCPVCQTLRTESVHVFMS